VLALAAAAVALAPGLMASDPAYPQLATALNRSGLPLALAAILGLTALGCFTLLGIGRPRRLWMVNLAGFLTLLAVVIAPLADLLNRQRQQPLQEIQIKAGSLIQPGEPLWVIGTRRYSTLFYARHRAVFLGDALEARKQLGRSPALVEVQPTTKSVLLLGDREQIEAFGPPSAQLQRLAKRGEQELWRLYLQGSGPVPGGAH
jgi:4-amino-4-deoxy-L-arabinose transferase-like glycosyltransferase